jgi:GNAT superfamily N-acetyltransferase
LGREKHALTFHPLTADRWDDFEKLFGERGACGGCWCRVWRQSRKEFEANKGAGNKAAMKAIVKKNAVPGILAYSDGEPIGWCAIAPRECYVTLERSRVLKAVDDVPVWSISCLFIAKPFRGQRVSIELIKAAVRFAREQGAKVVEGYPVEPKKEKMPDVFAWTGVSSAFLQAGFAEHHRGSPTRPIMRINVGRASSVRSGRK